MASPNRSPAEDSRHPRLAVLATGAREKGSRADDIIEADMEWVLTRGTVVWVETKKEELWHVEGKDVDERSIRLVVAAYEQDCAIKIVTVMDLAKKRR